MKTKLVRQLQWETAGKPSGWSEPPTWIHQPKFPWVEGKILEESTRWATPITVMDVGCFTGYFLRNLVEHHPGKFRGIGVDIQFELMDKLNHMTRLNGQPIVFEKRLPKVLVEVITCFDTLEHVSNDTLLIQRMAKRMKPGGVMFIHLPQDDQYEEANDEHLRVYHKEDFIHWLPSWELKVEEGKDEEGRPTWLVELRKP